MNPSIMSSYRSSASSSHRLRRIVRGQEDGSTDSKTATAHNNIESRSRNCSHDFSVSEISAASVKSASAPKSSAPSERLQQKQKESKQKPSESPVRAFFRIMFERCFSTRRRKRSRGTATRKMKSDNYQTNYQTRDDQGMIHGAKNARERPSTNVPSNEHEMFTMLHSKARAKSQRLSGNSSDGQITIRHRKNRDSRRTKQKQKQPPVRSISPPVIVIEHRRMGDQLLLS